MDLKMEIINGKQSARTLPASERYSAVDLNARLVQIKS